MKNWILLVIGLSLFLSSFAQRAPGSFSSGYKDVTFTDNSLNTPTVDARMYYPATASGANQPVANGVFPVVAFGHGFNLNYLDYENLCNHLASWGFVVISPDVQNGFNVSHQEYARELGACLDYVLGEGANASSDLYQKVDSLTGVYGHSMGGGASGLVATEYPGIDAISGLAAAETNPSAITSLGSYSGPFQTISGSSDNTAGELTNQIPMYNASLGDKQWVSIIGGAHCKFTDSNTICDLVSSPGSISRSEQQALANTYTTAFFRYYLYNDLDMLPWLCGDSLTSDPAVTYQTNINCTVTGRTPEPEPATLSVFPNPANDQVQVTGTTSLEVFSALGHRIDFSAQPISNGLQISVTDWPTGMYWLRSPAHGTFTRFIKQ